MNSYFVLFELGRPGENYANVVREIKRDASWLMFADTVFLIATEETVVDVRDRI